jgi:3-methyladenine DNA glycosylase AlkD
MMEQDILRELARQLGDKTKDARLKTSDVRSVSAAVYKQIEVKELNSVLDLAEALLRLRKWEYGVIAYDWAFRVREQYTEETFITFERWLKSYVTGWGDCDDFCAHALGALIAQHNELFPRVTLWTSHENFAIRRAAAVVLIYPIRKNRLGEIDPFVISDLLMNDPHYLV